MTHKKIFRVLALAAFTTMIVTAPLASVPDCQKKGNHEKMMGKGCQMAQGCMMLKSIPNLTEEQKAKLEKLHAECQKMMEAAKADMGKLAGEMQTLMKDPVDVKKVEAKIDEMARMHADMQKKCLAHCLAVRTLLSDEQKTKLGGMGCCGMMMHGMGCKMDDKHMEATKGAGCMNKHGQEKGACPKKTVEEKK